MRSENPAIRIKNVRAGRSTHLCVLAALCPSSGRYIGLRSSVEKRDRGPVTARLEGDAKRNTVASSWDLDGGEREGREGRE